MTISELFLTGIYQISHLTGIYQTSLHTGIYQTSLLTAICAKHLSIPDISNISPHRYIPNMSPHLHIPSISPHRHSKHLSSPAYTTHLSVFTQHPPHRCTSRSPAAALSRDCRLLGSSHPWSRCVKYSLLDSSHPWPRCVSIWASQGIADRHQQRWEVEGGMRVLLAFSHYLPMFFD